MRTFVYPERFAELVEMVQQPGFAKKFARAHLITSKAEIRDAQRDGLPKHLVPFLVQIQPTHLDYYVFNKRERGSERSVGVVAVHTVVFGWDNFEAFLAWFQAQVLLR